MVLLARFGSSVPVVVVRWVFRWGTGFGSVVTGCPSRSSAARLLWRFRAAGRWWLSPSAPPPSCVASASVPRFGLRWLAGRNCVVAVVEGPAVRRFRWGGFRRRLARVGWRWLRC